MFRTSIMILSALALMLTLSCTEPESSLPDWPWQDPEEEVQPEQKPEPAPEPEDPDTPVEPEPEPEPEPEQDPLPVIDATLDRWTDVSADYDALPAYIKVYRSPEALEGKHAVAYIAVADLDSAEWDIWSVRSDDSYVTSDSYKTPSDIYDEEKWLVVINGGFFYVSGGKNYTASLAVRDSEVLAYNINYASEDWKSIYYPTRAAFLELQDGSFDACWTYKRWDAHFMYPSPADNSWEAEPAAQPGEDYPEGGVTFESMTGIGGGPVLIDKGKYVDSYVQELFYGPTGISPDSDQPRSAIGVTSDCRMIFFVCEGRQMTEGVNGLTTADVANVLLDLECVEAINLDGGGSSCMLVNGKETIKVSDGSQRSVASTVMLK